MQLDSSLSLSFFIYFCCGCCCWKLYLSLISLDSAELAVYVSDNLWPWNQIKVKGQTRNVQDLGTPYTQLASRLFGSTFIITETLFFLFFFHASQKSYIYIWATWGWRGRWCKYLPDSASTRARGHNYINWCTCRRPRSVHPLPHKMVNWPVRWNWPPSIYCRPRSLHTQHKSLWN